MRFVEHLEAASGKELAKNRNSRRTQIWLKKVLVKFVPQSFRTESVGNIDLASMPKSFYTWYKLAKKVI